MSSPVHRLIEQLRFAVDAKLEDEKEHIINRKIPAIEEHINDIDQVETLEDLIREIEVTDMLIDDLIRRFEGCDEITDLLIELDRLLHDKVEKKIKELKEDVKIR